MVVALWLTGCVTPEPRGELPQSAVPVFSADPEQGAATPDRWWRAFNDPTLNTRVEHALAGNYDLAAAWERLNAARALARRTASALSPEVDASAGASRQESLNSNRDQTELSLGLVASYEVDLWGRIDSLAEAEALRAEATAGAYQVAAISLSSSVTLTWYQIAEAVAQLQLVQSQLETNQTFLNLLQERFDVGQIRQADVNRQRQLVEATREQAIVIQSRLDLFKHQLALLEGRPPQSPIDMPVAALPQLPASPSVGLPSDLLQRRPDVRAALLQLQAADKDLAAAVSDQYPRLNLTASIETAAERPARLFEEWLLSIAGQAVAPLIDGGERRAEIDRNQAIVRERLAAYGQSVLIAFGEVEDALALEARRAERLESLREQLRLAEQAVLLLEDQFFQGVSDYLAVLTALRDKQQLQRDVISARLDLIAARIALYRALAGGFDTPLQADEQRSQTELEEPEDEQSHDGQ